MVKTQNRNIRFARAEDVSIIYNLIKSCFPENYLIYSIYQAETSLEHLKNIIIQKEQGYSNEYFLVYDDHDGIKGFYNAREMGNYFFLNYIGTKPGFENNRIGSQLLDDFHYQGILKGSCAYQLDVYASNTIAYKWYSKNGYVDESVTNNLCFDEILVTNNKNDFVQKNYGELINVKKVEESSLGFSKVSIKKGQCSFDMMMIGGTVLRFQNLLNMQEDEVLELIAGTELTNRHFFLFTGRQEYQGMNKLLFKERVVRMVRK